MSSKKINIYAQGPFLPGSVTQVMVKCGKKKCLCKEDPDYFHGPYFRWTGNIEGRRTTVTLTKEEAVECQLRIKNWKSLQEKVALIAKNGLARAPWTDR
jgi:hypothetical protein